MTEAHINLQDDWPTIEQTLHQEAQQQRTSRLASRKNCQSLVSGLDWVTAKKAAKVLSKQQLQHMKTWNQAAIHYCEGDKIKPCPLCKVPATPKHIVWLCSWRHNKGHEPLAIERLQDPLEEPLWGHGWIPKEPQDHLQFPQPLQGHGCWSTLEPLTLQPWQGMAVTLDATPSSYDLRSQAWVFGLCIHTFSLGTLLKKGTITGMAPGRQTKARALFQGLITLAQFVLTPTNVVVQLGVVWGAWTNPRKRKGFEDLAHGLDAQFFQRITPLYIHKNHRTPDTPANEPHLRRRQRDAALAAYERASTLYDRQAEDWQQTLDQDHLQIYKQAAARLEKIYKDPQHFIHDKPVRRAGHATKQYKKRLINQCKAPWQPHKHQWVPHRSGYQCQTCHTRVHQALTVEVIETHLSQDCELLTHEAPEPDLRPDKPIGQKVTRTTAIKKLLEVQQQHPQAQDEHTFQETTGYLKCTKCNLSIHKRTNEESFQTFIHSTCIDAKYEQNHGGHSSHSLWQKGKAIRCVNCGTHSHLDGEEKVILTKALTNACQGNTQRSPTLLQLFGAQSQRPNRPPTTGSQATPPLSPGLQAEMTPPAPKKLRFSTETSEHNPAPQAMTPSPMEHPEEETGHDGDPEVEVDFF